MLRVAIRREPWVFAVSTLGSLLFGALTVADAWVLGWATEHVVIPAFRDGEIATGLLWAVLALFVGVALLRAVGIVARRLGAGVMQYRMQAHYRRAVTRQYLSLPMEWHQRHPTGQLLSNANADVEAAWGADRAAADGGRHGRDDGHRGRPDVRSPTWCWRWSGCWSSRWSIVANLAYQRLASPADDPGAGAARRGQRDRARVLRRRHGRQDAGPRGRGDRPVRRARRRAARRQHPRRADPRGVRSHAGRTAQPGCARRARRRGGPGASSAPPTPATSSPIAYLLTIVSFPIRSIGWLLGEFPRSVVGFERVQAVLDATGEMRVRRPAACRPATPGRRLEVDAPRPTPTSRTRSSSRAHLHVEPGRTVALVGATASGKSTLTTLLTRLLDPDDGRDPDRRHRPARPAPRWSGRRAWPWCRQTAFLFDDTVRGNVTLGADVTDDEVWAALRTAQADGFVAALPDGLDTRLGERGTSLSGGQRQRISLARALVRQPTPAGPRRRHLRGRPRGRGADPGRPARDRGRRRPWSWSPTARPPSRWPTRWSSSQDGRIADRGTHAELLVRNPGVRPPGQRLRAASTSTTWRAVPREHRHDHRDPRWTPARTSRPLETIRRGVALSPELKEGLAGHARRSR